MGTLANSLFLGLLGWVRTLTAEIWNAVTQPEDAALFGWLGANWKLIAVLLCAAGAVTDLIVYLIRWQPYRVWKSFFRRLKNREYEPEQEPESAAPAAHAQAEPVRGFRFEAKRAGAYTAEKEPEAEEPEPPETRRPASWGRVEPEGTTASFEQAILPQRRRRMSRLFSDGDEETQAPDQLIDRYEAYRRPVYPRSWKTEEKENEDGE